jgi:glutamyl-tRNA synthetase
VQEWLPSLPLHLDLYASLSLPAPQFAHIPILLNRDGTKMSKRKGDVQVLDFMRRNWEPEAILNWLALAGWGVHHDQPHQLPKTEGPSEFTQQWHPAPDSTAVMNLAQLISSFDLSSLTHRRSILDPTKLEFLNKHHLMRMWSTKEGLRSLAERVHSPIKEAFPSSPHTTVDYLMRVIKTLQGRLVNIQDIPAMAPYFFVDPDLTSDEARAMVQTISTDEYVRVLRAVYLRLEKETSSWHQLDIVPILNKEGERLKLSQKVLMTILRQALSGTKTGPSIPEIVSLLGRDRTLTRLSSPLQGKGNGE